MAENMFEAACFNVPSAIIAADNGAHRIELCKDQAAGGTTPPLDWLIQVKARVSIPVFVMIRPRGGDFNYTDSEYVRMQAELEAFKCSADGFVFGILNHEGKVDVSRTAELVRLAHPKPCTFHRAFDEAPDHLAALEGVVSSGCKAILTSGGKSNALEGVATLSNLVKASRGRVVIIAGGGIRAVNLTRIQSLTGATVMHSSCAPSSPSSSSLIGLPDVTEIREMLRLLR